MASYWNVLSSMSSRKGGNVWAGEYLKENVGLPSSLWSVTFFGNLVYFTMDFGSLNISRNDRYTLQQQTIYNFQTLS